MLQPKQTPKEKKNTKDATQMKGMRPVFKGPNSKLPQPKNLSGKAKNGTSMKKAQNGVTKKPVAKSTDSNTTIQKAKLDNKYNTTYRAMKNDSIKESNKILPETYEKLRRRNAGKSPNVATLRSAQDKMNKSIVKDSKAMKLNTKLDAKGRTENAMIKNAMNSYKSGGTMKKCKGGC
jgi:hypothetical protein